MMKMMKMTVIGLAAVMASAFVGGSVFAQEAEEKMYTSGEYQISVPAEYDELVQVDIPENDENGMLFSVSEKASLEAAGGAEGAGWLFGIRRVDEDELKEMLCRDCSGEDPFARDEEGNHYIFCHPTDVRLVRENYEFMDEDMKQFGELNEWAQTMKETFIDENEGLSADVHTNTDLDMILARIAYKDDVNYLLSSLEHLQQEPGDTDPAPFVGKLVNGMTIKASDAESPDGEYIVLQIPDENKRFDFFPYEGKENLIREVLTFDDEEYVMMYEAEFADGTTKLADVMQDWLKALAG